MSTLEPKIRMQKLVGHLTPSSTSSSSPDSYRYTTSNVGSILTAEQRRFYEENGYLVIKKLLSDEDVTRFYNRFDELVQNPHRRDPNMIVMRDVGLKTVKRSDRTAERVVTKLQNWSRDQVGMQSVFDHIVCIKSRDQMIPIHITGILGVRKAPRYREIC